MQVNHSTVLLLKSVLRLWRHLSRRRHRQFYLLIVLMLISAVAEVISLGAVIPFLGVLITPEKVLNYPLIAERVSAMGIYSPEQLVLPFTIIFVTAIVLAGAIRLSLLWVSTRLTYACGADISVDAYRRTLYQPYLTHVSRNSSEVISGIVHKVNGAVGSVLLPLLTLISSSVLIVSVMLALVSFDPIVASFVFIGFGSSYLLISWIIRRRLVRNSQRISHEQDRVIKVLNEGLGGIRDVLLDNTQSLYCDIYQDADIPLRRAVGSNIFISGSPRFVMEALGMVLIAALAYWLSLQPSGLTPALPLLGALALGAQRLLPALQQCYAAWASIVGNHVSLVHTLELLDQPLPSEDLKLLSSNNLYSFHDAVSFKNVRFRYSQDTPWVLDGLNLIIPKGSRVGVVGGTGSGKSTALDLLMGLLAPTEGKILVDDQLLDGEVLGKWQRCIAHVPQSIFLADTSFAENIAFGVPRDSINFQKVRVAARQAQIDSFIESGGGGYDALVGERGVRLSGGQRQRIGIARALYKQASVLVFDEATSALDNTTEQSVIEAIEGLDRELTVFFVAHRLTTVQNCEIIVELQNGKVVAQGTYDQLLACSSSFRRMARSVA